MNVKRKTAGGCPAASHFLLRRQKKVTKEKATPVCRPYGVPSLRRKRAGLRNSHDPLRGHVLKQCSPNPTARSRLIEAVHMGTKNKAKQNGWALPTMSGEARLITTTNRARSAHKTALFLFP